jgi:peptidoglycan/LPS O-acetylase OafA/YrhL
VKRDLSAGVRPAYMKQLDGLRALAVLFTLAAHFLPTDQPGWDVLPWGQWGVRLFFVLSGFLITSILLRLRPAESGGETWFPIRQFYVRRFLRIFPVFYATLLVTAVLNIKPVRSTFFWHLTYLSNIYFARLGAFNGPVTHFWSLAVEEQFYLFWPWLMVFLPARALRPAIAITILLGPLTRLAGYLAGYNSVSYGMFTTSCLDTLGAGALLALLADARFGDRVLKEKFLAWSLRVGLVSSIALLCSTLCVRQIRSFLFSRIAGSRSFLFGWLRVRHVHSEESLGACWSGAPPWSLGRLATACMFSTTSCRLWSSTP